MHERYRQTDADGRTTTYSEGEREFTFMFAKNGHSLHSNGHKTSDKQNLLLSRGSVEILCTWYHVQSINTTVMLQLLSQSAVSLTLASVISAADSKMLSEIYSFKLTASTLGKTSTVYKNSNNMQLHSAHRPNNTTVIRNVN